MRLPPYPNYKPSGEAWVPELPESWDLVRLRWLSERYAGGTPDKGNSAFWDDGDIPWLNSGAVNDGYITEPSEYITREGFLGSSAKWIPKGALVMALAGQGKTKGMVAQLGFAASCNQSMAAIIPINRIQARYLYWWLAANYFNIRNMAGGEARDGLNLDLLGGIPCPVPDRDAQCAIADFLDRETAKIDTLVAKKRTLIERLKEKRTALISRTVTRGLPPDAARAAGLDPHPKLKPSGIDWLGDVPEHWNVKPLKRAIRFLEGPGIMASDFVDEGIPLLRIASIGGPKVTLEGCNYLLATRVGERWAHFRVRCGDLLISGSASTGFCSEVDETTEGAIPYTGIIIIRLMENVTEKAFVRWFFLSESFLLQAELARSGSTIQHFGPSHLSRMNMAVPPNSEQRHIADFLDRETAKIDGMAAKVETAIERLQEYRTALITAAVTGKIDVRGAVA
jgi:type I restriction enzyme S subunit